MSMQRRTRELLQEHSEYCARRLFAQVIHGVRQSGADEVCLRDRLDALELVYPEAVFTGWTAAGLHGIEYAEGHPPELWLPKQRTRSGVIIRTGALPADDVRIVLGRRATSAVRTAFDLGRHEYRDQAIAAIEQCIRPNEFGIAATTVEEIEAYIRDHPGSHNTRAVRRALAEVVPGAQSPWETFTRLVVHRSGLVMFEPQCPIPGTALHTDLGSAGHRIAIEYEGDYHRGSEQHKRDIARWNRITGEKWTLILVSSTMLTSTPARTSFVAQIAGELHARGWVGPAPSTPELHLYPETGTTTQADVAVSA